MILISAGQSLVDVAMQELGTIEGLAELAAANGIRITDRLTPGQQLVVPAAVATLPDVVRYYRQRGHRINTLNRPAPAAAPDGLRDFVLNDVKREDFY